MSNPFKTSRAKAHESHCACVGETWTCTAFHFSTEKVTPYLTIIQGAC